MRALKIASELTAAFPETGGVWTRSIEIKNLSNVTCTGFATSNSDCLRMVEALRKTKGAQELKISQLRGEKPVQFSLAYRWDPAGGDDE